MAEAFGVEEIGARGPVAVLVGEHALEHEDLLAVGMIVRREARARLVAHDGSDLARLGRTHEVDPLAPNGAAGAWRPGHPGRVGHGPDGQGSVDYFCSSANASSRFARIAGRATITSRIAEAIMKPRLIGFWKNTNGSPRERSIARRRFSSIRGPRMKPRIIGAGSHSSLTQI